MVTPSPADETLNLEESWCIHSNKSNETHTTHQQLYDTLYESITLDQDALDAQAAQSSFHKRSHDNQDPLNNREGENKKKRRKNVGEPSSRSSRYSYPKTFQPKMVSKEVKAKRRTAWFDLFLKLDIDKNENHIHGPSTISIEKKFKELIQKDKLTIADLEGAGLERIKVQYNNDVELEYHVNRLKAATLLVAQWNNDEGYVSKPRSFERHMSKSTKPHPYFYNKDYSYFVNLSTKEKYTTFITNHYDARYYKEGIEDMIPERWSKEVHRCHFEALNVRRSDDKENELSYADLPRLNVNDVEDMYLLQVQDKLHHLPFEFVKDFNNSLLMFIKRIVIKNRVEDIRLGVESYQRTLNLTKPTMFFEEIDQSIPFTMTATHKGVMYFNQYNIKSLMMLSEVKKFYNGTLVKIQENLIDMLSKNKLGSSNKRLKGRDWTDYDVKSSK
nr:hypothetical protein [Tanacetum cinerariifolium]